jgi:hypothetical protein
MLWLLVTANIFPTANIVPTSPILVTLMIRAYFPQKRRFLKEPHGATSHMTTFFSANVVPSSPILVTLLMEAIRSYETSVLTSATRRNILQNGILLCLYFS